MSEVLGCTDDGLSSAHLAARYWLSDEPLDNAALSRLAGRSLRAFERSLAEEKHLTPQQYLRRIRVRHASHELVRTRRGIGDIAHEHGFCDQSPPTPDAWKIDAKMMGRAHELGSIEKGKLADVLVVNSDVMKDISILENRDNVLAVMQGGVVKAGTLLKPASL